jgi:electron transport complex protein RnfC
LFGKQTFKGGIHLLTYKKQIKVLPIEILPAPEKVILPVSMHHGVHAKIVIKLGDTVKIGQLLAEACGNFSASVHASISGEVTSIGLFSHPSGKQCTAIEIFNNHRDEQIPFQPLEKDWQEAAPGEITNKIAACGIVGMSGSGIPTHLKLSPPSNKKIDTLIVNCTESEPYCSADHRIMLERTSEIITAILISKKTLGVRNVLFAMDNDKRDILELISKTELKRHDISIVKVQTKYPQGSEKQLIETTLKRQIPSGGTAEDIGCVVMNVQTLFGLWNAVCNGVPLFQRVLTVGGPSIRKPANLLVRIGTPIRHVLEYCKVDMSTMKKCIMGGPMRGIAVPDINAPVIKTTTGIIAYNRIFPGLREYPCINCGNCVYVCPIRLVPSSLVRAVEKGLYQEAYRCDILECIECGACTYICPAKINLAHFLKLGKFHLLESGKNSLPKKTTPSRNQSLL